MSSTVIASLIFNLRIGIRITAIAVIATTPPVILKSEVREFMTSFSTSVYIVSILLRSMSEVSITIILEAANVVDVATRLSNVTRTRTTLVEVELMTILWLAVSWSVSYTSITRVEAISLLDTLVIIVWLVNDISWFFNTWNSPETSGSRSC
jgi:hypothetical protein